MHVRHHKLRHVITSSRINKRDLLQRGAQIFTIWRSVFSENWHVTNLSVSACRRFILSAISNDLDIPNIVARLALDNMYIYLPNQSNVYSYSFAYLGK